MKLSKLSSFKIGEIEFDVKFTNRSVIDYEELSGESIVHIDDDTKTATKKQLMFYYATAKAGAKAAGKEFNYSFDQFLDLIDDHYAETMLQFSRALYSPEAAKKK